MRGRKSTLGSTLGFFTVVQNMGASGHFTPGGPGRQKAIAANPNFKFLNIKLNM